MNIMQMNEHEQWEVIKTWWKENGKMIIIVAIIAVLASVGFRYWQQRHTQQTEQASVLYDQLLLADLSLHSEQLTQQVASQLQKSYPNTPYAALAALLEAKLAVDKQDLKAAQQKLQWVIEHAKNNDLKQIARLRAARVLLALKQPDNALTLLDTVNEPAYMTAINQIKGDIFMAQGKPDAAREAYQAALKNLPPTEPIYPYLQMQANQ